MMNASQVFDNAQIIGVTFSKAIAACVAHGGDIVGSRSERCDKHVGGESIDVHDDRILIEITLLKYLLF
jgi:hypothetical protein